MVRRGPAAVVETRGIRNYPIPLAEGVDRLASHETQLAIHSSPDIEVSRRSASRWSGPMPVLLPARRDVSVELPVLASFQVGGAAVPGVGDQGIRQLSGICLDPLQHRHQMHRITGLVADANGHDHLEVSVHRSLSAVALDPAACCTLAARLIAPGVGCFSLLLSLGFAHQGPHQTLQLPLAFEYALVTHGIVFTAIGPGLAIRSILITPDRSP